MLGELFQSQNEAAARDLILRPPPVQKTTPTFNAWNFGTAAPRGVVAGAAEGGAFASDIIGAFGQVVGAYPEALGGVAPLGQDQQKQAEQQRQRLLTQGIDFSSEVGDSFRGSARFYAPDPQTAHVAENLVFNFARFGTKATAYVAGGGPVAGGFALAGDEGMAVADELKQQGVDLSTRTKVGAVVGGFSGLGVLPLAGQTAARTAGLVLAGGPLSYMAQQQAARSILDGADYSKLAEQYDPFDPVGLAVSTLIPAAFGVHGLRANKAAAAARAAEDFRTGPVPSQETPIASAAREQAGRVSEDQIDAARVLLQRDDVQKSNLFHPDDWRAYDVHETALARAMDQIAAGEPVRVTDTIAAPDLTAARETLTQIDALTAEREQLLPVAGGLAEAGAVRSAREELRLMEQQRPDTSDAAARDLAKTIQEAQGVSYKAALAQAKKQLDGAVSDFTARQDRLNTLIEQNAAAQKATQRIGALDAKISALERQLGPEAKLADFENKVRSSAVALAQELRAAPRGEPPITLTPPKDGQPNAAAPAKPAAPVKNGTQVEPKAPDGAGAFPAPGEAKPAAARPAGDTAAAGLVDQALATRAQALESMHPDMMVQLEGMDYPAPLSEVMAAARAEADEMLAGADLYQVAAECALTLGL